MDKMECRDDAEDDVLDAADTNAATENTTTTAKRRNIKLPKKKRKFVRAKHGLSSSISKRQRNGAAAAGDDVQPNIDRAAGDDNIATPSPTNKQQQRYTSQDVQKAEKKAAGYFKECEKVQNKLTAEEAKNYQLQQQVLQLQQQLRNERIMHKSEVKKTIDDQKQLKQQLLNEREAHKRNLENTIASHTAELNKQTKLYIAQQNRYKTKLSSTIDHSNDKERKAEEDCKAARVNADTVKKKAAEEVLASRKDSARVIQKERENTARVQKRLEERYRDKLMVLTELVTTVSKESPINERSRTNDEDIDEINEDVGMIDNSVTERELQQSKARVEELEAENATLQQYKPQIIQKIWIRNKNGKRGGALAWPHHVLLMIMEQLSNRTPPSCIASNILSTTAAIMPSAVDNIVKQLPTTRFVRSVRSILVVTTKTLAAYVVAKLPNFQQIFTDGTSRRQHELINVLIGYTTDDGIKTVTLDNMILAADKKSISTAKAIMNAMDNAQQLLRGWIDVTKEMYPGDDIVSSIPLPDDASFLKLRNGFITTDTCSQAKNVRRDLILAIKELAREKGDDTDEFEMHELDCWNHLRNLWIEHAVKALEKEVKLLLAEDLVDIPSIYRVDIDINHILRGVDKEFAVTANYPKGHGMVFQHWMETFHPGALLFPTARMLGGTRQDAVTEGSLPLYMNRHFYLEFLHLRLCAGSGEGNILQTNLFLVLSCIEMVAVLRVLSIVHVSIVMPMRFLCGKCHELNGFSVSRLPEVLDLLYDASAKIADDGKLLLDEDHIMSIFKSVENDVPEFKSYMQHILQEKKMHVVGDRRKDSTKIGMEDVRTELFAPIRIQNRQTSRNARKFAETFAASILDTLSNPKMTTKDYLSAADGKYSMRNQSEARVAASTQLCGTNDPSEGGHAASTAALKTSGTIRLDHAGAEGQSRANNDFGRGHEQLIDRRKKDDSDSNNNVLGTFHELAEKLQRSLLVFAQREKDNCRKQFDALLEEQKRSAREREEVALRNKLDREQTQHITNTYLLEEYDKPRCWRTIAEAEEQYKALGNKTAQMKEVKNQILIRYLGCGWVDAYHPWSKGNHTYTHDELFEHLKRKVIPLSETKTVPNSPPVTLPDLPEAAKLSLGQLTHDRVSLENRALDGEEDFKEKARAKRDQLEASGHGSKYEEWQRRSMPAIESLKDFQIEFLFDVSYDDETCGGSELVWMNGVVTEIVSSKKNKVKIKWEEKWLTEGESSESEQVLLKSMWNHKQAKAGAWREHFTE